MPNSEPLKVKTSPVAVRTVGSMIPVGATQKPMTIRRQPKTQRKVAEPS